jgi:hypothetical protein
MNVATTRAEFEGGEGGLAGSPSAQGIEEDLFSLSALAPQLLADVPVLFEQTVRDSLSYMLGTRESAGVLSWFRGDELMCRDGVFARLLEVYGTKASPIQNMIDRVFGLRVHQLLQQLP